VVERANGAIKLIKKKIMTKESKTILTVFCAMIAPPPNEATPGKVCTCVGLIPLSKYVIDAMSNKKKLKISWLYQNNQSGGGSALSWWDWDFECQNEQ
jgi:hypothetical protein